MSKPKEILEIEKRYGITLNEIALSENIMDYRNSNCYQLNSKNEITGLNLRDNQLTEIKGLEQLTQLQRLDLSNNQLTEIKGLEQLTQLQDLRLSNNLLTEIKGLEQLTQLQTLWLNNNQLTEIKGLEKLTQLQVLYLSSNPLTEIKGLEQLTQLISLDLRWNQLTEIKGLEQLTQLQYLDLSSNRLTEIKGLEQLTQLQRLDLSNNQLTEIKGLEQLTQLQYLDLSSNHLTEIKGLEQLTQLQTLWLSDNQLTEIKGLEQLTQLQTLDLSNNLLTEIKGLEQLTQLQKLYLYNNQLTEIKGLEQLTQLQYLNLSSNHLTNIKGLEQLTQLQTLDLSSNQLTEIKGLEQLSHLQELYLRDNQLADIKELEKTIRQKDFTKLQIDNNPLMQQASLFLESTVEYLEYGWKVNHKDDILKYFSDIDDKQKKEEITLPVKIMFLGNHAAGKTTFLRYLLYGSLSKKKIKSTHVLEVYSYPVDQRNNKLLPQAMIYDFGGQDYYHGIYRAFFSENSITVLFWCNESNKNDIRKANDKTDCNTYDFTWNYWLFQLDEAMNQRSKEEDTKEPLLLVQTHADMPNNKESIYSDILNNLTNFEIKGKYFIALLEEAKEKINNKKSILRLKEDLLDTMQEKATSTVKPVYYEKFLHYVLNFKGAEYVRVKEDILDAGYYKRETINNETNDDLLSYLKVDLYQLHLQGLVLYYRNSPIDDIVWLNSSKTIEHIFNDILKEDVITKNNGRIDEDDFDNLWKESKTKKEIFETIKELLINEKIVFHDESEKKYIVPSFLPLFSEDKEYLGKLSQEEREYLSQSFDFKGQLPSFILKFRNFIPFGLINELICLYGNLPYLKYYWRNQLIFRFDDKYKVWIKFNFPQLSIEVYINELNKFAESKLELNEVRTAIFLNIIDLLNRDDSALWFYNNEIPNFSERVKQYIQKKESKKIEFPKEMYISVGDAFYVNPANFYDNTPMIPAYELTDSGETTKEGKKIEVLKKDATTCEIELYKDFINKHVAVTKMKKKIFISYSREDVDYKNELKKYLNMLDLFNIADNWSCDKISIEKWHEKIQKELQESDLIIYMLSANFFNSKYIIENEVNIGVKQVSEDKNKKIVCVIVSEFPGLRTLDTLKDLLKGKLITDTQEAIIKLSEWQYLPYGTEENKVTGNTKEKIIPLKSYPNIEEAYAQIAEKVRQELTRSNLT